MKVNFRIKMFKFITILRNLIPKLSYKYLLFITIVIAGCSYQVIQVIQVFLKFETKIDVSYDQSNEIAIPMVSFCRRTDNMFRNSSQQIKGLSPAQLYNHTLKFGEVFFSMKFIISNDKYKEINFVEENQNINEIYYEKMISDTLVCYQFKYLHSKQLKYKQEKIYTFRLYQGSMDVYNYPYLLFLSSDGNDPNLKTDNKLYLFGNNYFP